MIRTIIVLIMVVLIVILSLPFLLIELIIGLFSKKVRDISSLRLVQLVFKIILLLSGTKVTVKGKENLPTDRSVLYVGNHRSYFDIIICYSLMPTLTGFISKQEMNKVPIIRLWMLFVKCLFMDRDDLKQSMKVILAAIEHVKQGISIFIFPEGTRNKEEGTFLPFKQGSFKIATKTGCDVIPVAINNSASAFEDHFPQIRRTHVTVEFGKPIVVKDMSKEDQKNLADIARNNIITMYNNNKAQIS